jgi:hypothetical protein
MEQNYSPSPGKQAIYSPLAPTASLDTRVVNALPGQSETINSSLPMRGVAFCTGAAILAALTWAVIDAGNLTGSSAALPIALAAGIAVGASVLPRIRSRVLVCGMVLALVAGEMSGLLAVAERVVVSRDLSASKLVGTNSTAAGIVSMIERKEAELTSHRSTAASTVATKGCALECRTLLEGQGAAIVAEIAAARVELKNAPVARSTTPLADRLGVQSWVLDLLAALLLSVGANGLAAVLIAWASQAGLSRDPKANQASRLVANAGVPLMPLVMTAQTEQTPVGTGVELAEHSPEKALVEAVKKAGGELTAGQRGMSKLIGCSLTHTNRVLHGLVAAGVLAAVSAGQGGTTLRLL